MLFVFRWLPSQGLAPLLIIIQNSALSRFRKFSGSGRFERRHGSIGPVLLLVTNARRPLSRFPLTGTVFEQFQVGRPHVILLIHYPRQRLATDCRHIGIFAEDHRLLP